MSDVNKRKVFLSHAEPDKVLAKHVEQLLGGVSHGMIEVWRSTSTGGIAPGDKPYEKIHAELARAGKIIAVFTRVSCARPWITWEMAYVAGIGGRKVIPLLCGVNRQDIPAPLREFKCYSAESAVHMTELLAELLKDLNLAVDTGFLATPVGSFCTDVKNYISGLHVGSTTSHIRSGGSSSVPNEFELTKHDDFTRFLIDCLGDPNTKSIQLITYTVEVDYGLIARFHVRGEKTIEVYKRSILADLAEQQEFNLRRLAANYLVRRWDKRQLSMEASQHLASVGLEGTTVTQYFYEGPPTKRAYVVDAEEAITAYYVTVHNTCKPGGSRYKGVTGSPKALKVSRQTALGEFVLDELANHMLSVKMHGRSWEEERRILLERAPWRGEGRRPCVEPRAVLLDLDGVLYASLPAYVDAWQTAFRSIGVDFPTDEVYRQEGRRGRETIVEYLRKIGWKERSITDDVVEKVYRLKSKEMKERDNPWPLRGAKELTRAISDSGLEMWVVTGSSGSGATDRIESDFDGVIPGAHVITGNDVRAGKPDPDPFLLACLRAGVHPHESVVIENAPLGIESADRAGTFCIAVNTGMLENRELEAAGARVVFESCEKLAEVWGNVVEILRE